MHFNSGSSYNKQIDKVCFNKGFIRFSGDGKLLLIIIYTSEKITKVTLFEVTARRILVWKNIRT